jgi:hypothetical protein
MEETGGRRRIECLHEGALCILDLPGSSVRGERDERGARRRSQELSRVHGMVAVEEGVAQREGPGVARGVVGTK